MFSTTRRQLDGPPFALPPTIDRLAERWRRARPRTRLLAGVSTFVLVVLAGVAHVAASPHGPPGVAWVAARDLAVGEVPTADDLQRMTWPTSLLPDGALQEPPSGRLVAPLPRGAIATDRHLGDGGVAAGLANGTAAVPVPVEVLPDLPVGVRIDLVGGDLGGGAHHLASDATVLQVDEVAVWLAVDRQSAAQVAAAALHGPIGVVVLPP